MTPTSPIVLPRPNLGPEPWPNAAPGGRGCSPPRSPPGWSPCSADGSAGEPGRKAEAVLSGVVAEPMPFPACELTDRVRSALLRAFGPTWRARTTEEVAASPDLVARFGEEVAGRVVDYLRAVDRSKFSADPAGPADELDWWASRFAEEFESAPAGGPAKDTSKSNGR